MATIGDPLADIGYMMIHWIEPNDKVGRFNLQAVTVAAGVPDAAGDDRALRGALGALDAGARLVRDARDLEGRRVHGGQLQASVTGATDDPYLKTFGEGVVELAERALEVTRNGF